MTQSFVGGAHQQEAILHASVDMDRPGLVAKMAPEITANGDCGECGKGGPVIGVIAVCSSNETEQCDLQKIFIRYVTTVKAA
jgi:hypothetical protein